MNQLAVIDDLAARRSAAARKAVETRRRNLAAGASRNPIAEAFAVGPTPKEMALHAWDQAVKASESGEMPDWHLAALALKAALTGGREWQASKARVLRQERPVAIPAPAWPDYRVDNLSSFKIRNPTLVVTFADGEIVRAPAVSARDKPVNIGRGLRVAIAFYLARRARAKGKSACGFTAKVPAITNCLCEDTGEIYNAELCTAKTIDHRLGHDGRRIQGLPPGDR
jgi:hypothetical protein